MSFIIAFINKNSNFLTFLFLAILSCYMLFKYNDYPKTQLYSKLFCLQANAEEKSLQIKNYFSLRKKNQGLVKENNLLQEKYLNLLQEKSKQDSNSAYVFKSQSQVYKLSPAQIIDFTIYGSENYITLRMPDSVKVKKGLGIISTKGVIGQINYTHKNYAHALSILHPDIKIRARIKNNNHSGLVVWKGEDPRIVHLSRIPKFVELEIGDTIETDSRSLVYPEGIPIGEIVDIKLDTSTNNWDIFVQLFENLNTVENVQIVYNIEKEIIDTLQAKQEELYVE